MIEEDMLERLPAPRPSRTLVSRTRRAALSALVAARPATAFSAAGWLRLALPSVLVALLGGYMRWAVEAVNALHR